MLLLQRPDLANADPVFTGTGTAAGNRPGDQTFIRCLCPVHCVTVSGRQYDERMEVAVSDMTHDGCQQTRLVQVTASGQQAFTEL